MSNPPNRLANYRSVSYYHVLVLCDTTETASAILDSTNEETWKHPTSADSSVDQFARLGKYAPRSVSLPNSVGLYSVIINGAEDADFSITNATWTCATAAEATPFDRGTSIAYEGTLAVSEPRGIVFADTIVAVCGGMNISMAQGVFVLKTFFVGHSHNVFTGEDTPEAITDIDPFVFTLASLEARITESGGEYSMTMVGMSHGVTRLPQYSQAPAAFSINTGRTLNDALNNLQAAISRQYESYKKCVVSSMAASITDDVQRSNVLSRLANVKYVITCDDVYKSPEYTVCAPPSTADTPTCCAQGVLPFQAGMSIEDMIGYIMSQSPKVQEDAEDRHKDKSAFRPTTYASKTHTSLTSRKISNAQGASTVEFTVTYHVKRFPEPKSFNFIEAALDIDDSLANIPPELSRNTITFDYIYTGKNTDILDFDITMAAGLAYLQIATMSNSTRNSTSIVPTRVISPAKNASIQNNQSPIPIFFGNVVTAPAFRNVTAPSSGSQLMYNLTQHSSLETAELSMRIYGNPGLLNTVNRQSMIRNSLTLGEEVLSDFTTHPAFARVNIKMPRTNDDILLFGGIPEYDGGSSDFTKDVWFRGFYYIYGIMNIFENGEFQQMLQLLRIPSKSIQDINNNTDTIELDFNKRVKECYDHVTPGAKSEKAAAVPHATPKTVEDQRANPTKPAATTAAPTNSKDVQSALDAASAKGLDGVKGWSAADPAVKNAIVAAGNIYPNIDALMLARIAAAESNLGKANKNAQSTASGPFQFIESTWMGLVRQNKIPGIPPNTPESEALPLRYDVNYAAKAAASNLNISAGKVDPTDINMYAVHHFGDPRGVKIANAAAAGAPTLDGVFSKDPATNASEWKKIVKANPGLASAKSPQDVMDFLAGLLARKSSVDIPINTPRGQKKTQGPVDEWVQSNLPSGATDLTPVGFGLRAKTGKNAVEKATSADTKPANKLKPCADDQSQSSQAADKKTVTPAPSNNYPTAPPRKQSKQSERGGWNPTEPYNPPKPYGQDSNKRPVPLKDVAASDNSKKK